MAGTPSNALDPTDWAIVAQLQRDGRMPFAELGRLVGLDEAAATERVRRLVAAGVITGYRATVDLAKLGFPVIASVQLVMPVQRRQPLDRLIAKHREILECLWVAADGHHLLRIAASSKYHLQEIVAALSQLGTVSTSVVTAAPLPARGIVAPVPPSR